MSTQNAPQRTPYRRRPGEGIEMPVEQVNDWVARFDELEPDPDAFRDADNPDMRLGIRWVISPNNMAGPAKVDKPHSFHLCYIQSEPGHHPVLHAHEYTETFICPTLASTRSTGATRARTRSSSTLTTLFRCRRT